jgi:hypothetical protein
MAYESVIKGRAQGAFTAAMLDAIKSAGQDRALPMDEVYRYVQVKLKKQYEDVQPRIMVGSDPPFL